MKNLKKVAAVLAAAMAMNAVAVTGAFSASAADDADIIANVSLNYFLSNHRLTWKLL